MLKDFRDDIGPSFTLYGASGIRYQVDVEFMDGRAYFGLGFFAFAEREKFIDGDVVLFALVGPHTFTSQLFARAGAELPFSQRAGRVRHGGGQADVHADAGASAGPGAGIVPNEAPVPAVLPVVGNAEVQPQEHAPLAGGVAEGVHLPEEALQMRVCLGPNVAIGAGLMQRLVNVWANHGGPYALYAGRIVESHQTAFISKVLPRHARNVSLFMGDDGAAFPGFYSRSPIDGLSRISKGWKEFFEINAIAVGSVYIFAVRVAVPGLIVRVFPA
ncbi:hypothetical protein BS78_02G399600 [Paspalum vaginatum]|nr:hypothetical protein BS78_02G399600 [Paspalum vaginatum]